MHYSHILVSAIASTTSLPSSSSSSSSSSPSSSSSASTTTNSSPSTTPTPTGHLLLCAPTLPSINNKYLTLHPANNSPQIYSAGPTAPTTFLATLFTFNPTNGSLTTPDPSDRSKVLFAKTADVPDPLWFFTLADTTEYKGYAVYRDVCDGPGTGTGNGTMQQQQQQALLVCADGGVARAFGYDESYGALKHASVGGVDDWGVQVYFVPA